MKETITKEMIETLHEIVKKKAYYDPSDCRNAIIPFEDLCGVNSSVFEILDVALQHLKIKASHSLIEYGTPEPLEKKNNDWTKEKGFHLKNKPLPLFDWNLVKA